METIGRMECCHKQEKLQIMKSRDLHLYCSWVPELPEKITLGKDSAFCQPFIELLKGNFTQIFTSSTLEAAQLVKYQTINYYVDSLPKRILPTSGQSLNKK